MDRPRLEDLEARYSGLIPRHLRDQAMDLPADGSAEARAAAWGRVRYWAHRSRLLKKNDPRQRILARHWLASALAAWRAARLSHEAKVLAKAQREGLAHLGRLLTQAAQRPEAPEPPMRAMRPRATSETEPGTREI